MVQNKISFHILSNEIQSLQKAIESSNKVYKKNISYTKKSDQLILIEMDYYQEYDIYILGFAYAEYYKKLNKPSIVFPFNKKSTQILAKGEHFFDIIIDDEEKFNQIITIHNKKFDTNFKLINTILDEVKWCKISGTDITYNQLFSLAFFEVFFYDDLPSPL